MAFTLSTDSELEAALDSLATSEGVSRQEVVRRDTGHLLLYVPVVDPHEFDVAISYLVRRLEENTSSENFLSAAFDLHSDPGLFALAPGDEAPVVQKDDGTVGIGGVYLCIYGMDSPGGYQLVGRRRAAARHHHLPDLPWR